MGALPDSGVAQESPPSGAELLVGGWVYADAIIVLSIIIVIIPSCIKIITQCYMRLVIWGGS